MKHIVAGAAEVDLKRSREAKHTVLKVSSIKDEEF